MMDWFEDSALRWAVLQGTSSRSLRAIAVKGLPIWRSVSIRRRSETSSLSRAFSWTALSWQSDTWFSLSMRLWFSVRSRTTWDQSSSRCFCFLILDLRADSLFEIILLCLLSSMILSCCSSASSEVEFVLRLDEYWGVVVLVVVPNSCPVTGGPTWEFGKLVKKPLKYWRFVMLLLLWSMPKVAGTSDEIWFWSDAR